MPFTEACDKRLHYEVHGEGEPLLLVMGLGADSLAWALQIQPFAERYQAIVFDNRDVGRSEQVEDDYEISDMADDTLGLADELGLDSFHLVGLSMGGAIAQELALAAPERVRTLTLCVTWGGDGRWGREQARVRTASVPHVSYEDRVDNLLVLTLSQELYENAEAVDYMRNVMLQHPYPQPAEAFLRQASACGRHETCDRLPSLSMPVHVIGAEHDLLVPVWKSTELAELVPGAKLTVIERAAHGANLERAEEFNRAVLDFLASAGGGLSGTTPT